MPLAGCSGREEAKKAAEKKPDAPVKKEKGKCPLATPECQNMLACDGGTDVYAKAKKANGGKDPVIKRGTTSSGFDAETDTEKGVITINKNSDKCTSTESLIFELANLSRKADFDKVDKDAAAGKLSREEYIKASEKIEYENIKTTLKAVDKCKEKWGCKNHSFDLAGHGMAKDFDDYYDNYLANSHKEHYGKIWDEDCKDAYEKKK
jgi:hypothetical protein